MNTGTVNIKGKEYQTVALRVKQFRDEHPDWSILTKVINLDTFFEDLVICKTQICDESGKVLSEGHAEEKRGSSQINQTSALENCETSAVGRALAFLGYGGSEIASADEVANAINQQKVEKKSFAAPQPLAENASFITSQQGKYIWAKSTSAREKNGLGLKKEDVDETLIRLGYQESGRAKISIVPKDKFDEVMADLVLKSERNQQ